MEPGALLKRARIRQGLTQAAVARRAGTSQPVVSAYEHGRRDPSLVTLRRLVAATGLDLQLGLGVPASDLPPLADDAAHGRILVDVLSLADAIPTRRRADRIAFPRISST